MQTSNNLHYNEQVARNALRFVFATVILEGISILRSKPIPIKHAYDYLSMGSSIKCDMFRKSQHELYDILNDTEHDARMFLMQCVSVSIPCPAVQSALNQHDSMKYYPVELI
jgi:6-phosphogluconate dehydrogenase